MRKTCSCKICHQLSRVGGVNFTVFRLIGAHERVTKAQHLGCFKVNIKCKECSSFREPLKLKGFPCDGLNGLSHLIKDEFVVASISVVSVDSTNCNS
jgi:hypothetical protein